MNKEFAVTEEYQTKLLSFMLHNPEFCSIATESLSADQFSNKALRWFYSKLTEKDLSPTILKEELIQAAQHKEIKEEEISKYVGLYEVIKQRPLPVEEEHIRNRMHTFIRTQSIKQAILGIPDLMREERWEEIAEIITEATQAGLKMNDPGIDYFNKDVLEQRVKDRANQEKRRKCPLGIPELDMMTYGGIQNKQAGLIVGGTGRGKSVFLQWLARVSILMGKKVIYYTMELGEEQISDRFDSMLARVRPQELNDYQEEILQGVGKYIDMYEGTLKIKHFPMDGATVHTIKTFTKQLSLAGWAPDLVIVDYLDLLQPHRTYNDKVAEQDAVVKSLVGFAQEFDVAVWTATQLNRGGMVMETPDESAQAGYIGRQYIMDIVLWLAQTKEEKEDELMRVWVSKNRNGFAGKVVKLDTDYSYMTFYRESLGDAESGPVDDEKEETDIVEEKRDLQLLFEQSEEGQPVILE